MQPTLAAMPALTLAEFAETQSVGLTRFAYLLCGDRGLAEDLVQDAFTALYRRFGETLPLEAPVAYARRTIVNAHVSYRRRRASSALVLIDPPDTPTPGPDGGEQDVMWRAVATMRCRRGTASIRPSWLRAHVVFLLLHAGRDRSLELVAEPAGSHRAATDRGAVVYRHDGLMVTIYAFGPTGRPQQNYRALARQAGRHLVWGTTDLSRIVP